jgi:hypothetical protein
MRRRLIDAGLNRFRIGSPVPTRNGAKWNRHVPDRAYSAGSDGILLDARLRQVMSADIGTDILKPPGQAFKKVAVASTLCPACAQRVEHRTDFTIATVQTNIHDCVVTKLVANQILVIHACTTSPDASAEASEG